MRRVHDQEQAGSTPRAERRPKAGQPAVDPASGAPHEALESLQRAAGNSAVRQLLSPPGSSHTPTEIGSELPADIRRKAERRLGDQLGEVRLHTGAAAASYAEQLGGEAVTVGRDIFLGSDADDPATAEGERTLMHELTHVAQGGDQSSAIGVGRPTDQSAGRVSRPGSAAEREAARIGQAGLAAEPTAVIEVAPAGVAHRQLRVEEEEIQAEVPAPAAARSPEAEATQAETAAGLGTPQPSGPASPLATLFDAAIISRLREARDHVSAQPPDPHAAHSAILGARDAMKALAASYRQSNPLLHAKLWTWHNALLAVDIRVKAMAGEGPTYELIMSELQTAQEGIGSLRDQLS